MKQATRRYAPCSPSPNNTAAAKVDALMALCDRLETNLTATTRGKLLNAVLQEALEPAVEAVNA